MKVGKQIAVYGASVALNRGGVLLCTPILVASFGLVDFGLYSLALIVSQLLSNLLSLNGGIAVMREGAEDARRGVYLYRRFSSITVCAGTLLTMAVWPLDHSHAHWVGYAVLLGAAEGLQQLLLNWLRCQNRYFHFLFFSVLRTLGILLAIVLVHHQHGGLESLFCIQFLWCLGLVGLFAILGTRNLQSATAGTVSVSSVLCYALPMIPHAASQWIINGSDRLIIKWLAGEQALGIYSLAYSFAMVVMLVNSGMALALPQQIIQNYDQWSTGTTRCKALKAYTVIVITLLLMVLSGLELDRRTMQWFATGTAEVPVIVGLVAAGLYLQGIYYLYGNFYFYHRKTSTLAAQTAVAAVLNVGLTFVLVSRFGIIGAAVATLLTYVIYLTMLVAGLKNIEPRLKTMIRSDLKLVPLSVAGLFCLGILHGCCWR